jgi:hypothetical protein
MQGELVPELNIMKHGWNGCVLVDPTSLVLGANWN